MGYSVVTAPVQEIAETIATDDSPGLEHDLAADPAPPITHDPGPDERVLTDSDAIIERDVGSQPRARTYSYVTAQHSIRTDGDVAAQLSARTDPGGGVHPWSRHFLAKEYLHDPDKRGIWIGYYDARASTGGTGSELLRQQDHPGLAHAELCCIPAGDGE